MKPYCIYIGEAGVSITNSRGDVVDCVGSVEEALEYVEEDEHEVCVVV